MSDFYVVSTQSSPGCPECRELVHRLYGNMRTRCWCTISIECPTCHTEFDLERQSEVLADISEGHLGTTLESRIEAHPKRL